MLKNQALWLNLWKHANSEFSWREFNCKPYSVCSSLQRPKTRARAKLSRLAQVLRGKTSNHESLGEALASSASEDVNESRHFVFCVQFPPILHNSLVLLKRSENRKKTGCKMEPFSSFQKREKRRFRFHKMWFCVGRRASARCEAYYNDPTSQPRMLLRGKWKVNAWDMCITSSL